MWIESPDLAAAHSTSEVKMLTTPSVIDAITRVGIECSSELTELNDGERIP